jgi:hypothetical protein
LDIRDGKVSVDSDLYGVYRRDARISLHLVAIQDIAVARLRPTNWFYYRLSAALHSVAIPSICIGTFRFLVMLTWGNLVGCFGFPMFSPLVFVSKEIRFSRNSNENNGPCQALVRYVRRSYHHFWCLSLFVRSLKGLLRNRTAQGECGD